MTSLKVIVLLLVVTFVPSSGKEVEFNLTVDRSGNADMKCSFDGSSENKSIKNIRIAAVMDSSEENLAVLEENSDQVYTGNTTEIKATGNIAGMKGFLRLIMKENLTVLKYVCRVLVTHSDHNVETMESYKESKGNRIMIIMKYLLGDQMKKTVEKDNLRTEKSEEKILELIRQLVEQTEVDIKERMEQEVKQSEVEIKERVENLSKELDKEKQVKENLSKQLDKVKQGQENLSKKFDQLFVPKSCDDFRKNIFSTTISRITITTPESVKLFCDTMTDGGGWTVFQRRINGEIDFYRDWADYESGFGSYDSSFWLGLKALSNLVAQGKWELRVDFKYQGKNYYAKYSHFKIGDASTNYKLSVSGYSGNAGDNLSYNSGYVFSTYDRDHDSTSRQNCAVARQGAWWYGDCTYINLNGQWATKSIKGVDWRDTTNKDSATFTEMKIRRVG